MAAAARSVLRSTVACTRAAGSRLAAGPSPRTAPSPFRISTRKPPSPTIFRSPVELSTVSMETMLPYHSVTASALLNSMLSVAPRSYGWTLEDIDDL